MQSAQSIIWQEDSFSRSRRRARIIAPCLAKSSSPEHYLARFRSRLPEHNLLASLRRLPALSWRLHTRPMPRWLLLLMHVFKHVWHNKRIDSTFALCKYRSIKCPRNAVSLSVCRVQARPCVPWRHISTTMGECQSLLLRQLVQYIGNP